MWGWRSAKATRGRRCPCTALQTLDLIECSALVSLPERLGEVTTLQTLNLNGCRGLVSLSERLGGCTGLQTLILNGCSGLASLPDLSGLAQLVVKDLPYHLQPWKASGYKAGSLPKSHYPEGWPELSAEDCKGTSGRQHKADLVRRAHLAWKSRPNRLVDCP